MIKTLDPDSDSLRNQQQNLSLPSAARLHILKFKDFQTSRQTVKNRVNHVRIRCCHFVRGGAISSFLWFRFSLPFAVIYPKVRRSPKFSCNPQSACVTKISVHTSACCVNSALTTLFSVSCYLTNIYDGNKASHLSSRTSAIFSCSNSF